MCKRDMEFLHSSSNTPTQTVKRSKTIQNDPRCQLCRLLGGQKLHPGMDGKVVLVMRHAPGVGEWWNDMTSWFSREEKHQRGGTKKLEGEE